MSFCALLTFHTIFRYLLLIFQFSFTGLSLASNEQSFIISTFNTFVFIGSVFIFINYDNFFYF